MTPQSGDIKIIKQIDAYLKNQLSEEETEEFWIELLKNPTYMEYLETELTVKSILEEKNRGTAGSSERAVTMLKKSWKWFAAAASVAILVIATNLLRTETPASLRDETIGTINMTTNLAAPLVMRSQKSTLSGADSLMNIGFEAALSGDISRAITMYKDVISQYGGEPAVAQAHLNIGIIRYNSGAYKSASQAFQQALAKVRNDELLKEKAYWYLGNAYINLDQLEKAREAIHNVYAMDGTYRKPAFRLLRKLDYEMGNIDADELE